MLTTGRPTTGTAVVAVVVVGGNVVADAGTAPGCVVVVSGGTVVVVSGAIVDVVSGIVVDVIDGGTVEVCCEADAPSLPRPTARVTPTTSMTTATKGVSHSFGLPRNSLGVTGKI